MHIAPLKRSLVDRARELGITKIHLSFSGGNDEGYLDVSCDSGTINSNDLNKFLSDTEDWAWGAYDFSGAGDGTDFGDNITYDLEKGVATHRDWWYDRVDGEETEVEL